jgi:hypothetical protein
MKRFEPAIGYVKTPHQSWVATFCCVVPLSGIVRIAGAVLGSVEAGRYSPFEKDLFQRACRDS